MGIERRDTKDDIEYLARKLVNLKLWSSESGKPWRKSAKDNGYGVLLVSHQFAASYANSHGSDLLGIDQYLHFVGCFATVYELWMVHSMMHIYAVGGHPGMQSKALLDLLRADQRRGSVQEDTVDFLIENFRSSSFIQASNSFLHTDSPSSSENDRAPLLY